MKKEKGSISIYAAISFTCIIALVLTLIEAGRYEYCGANLSIVTNNAVESAMGDYANELVDEYGLFLNVNTDDELVGKIDEYVLANISGFEGDYIDLLSVANYEIPSREIKHITDDGGSFMAKEVSDYMKIKVGEDAASALIDKYGNSAAIGNISSFIKSVKSAKKKIERVAEAASDLYDAYENIKNTADEIKDDIRGIKKAVKNMREVIEDYKADECEFEDLEKAYNILVGQVDNLKKDLEDISSFGEKATDSKSEYEQGKEEAQSIYGQIWPDEETPETEDELLDNYDDVKDVIEVIEGIDLSDFDKTKKLAEENAIKIIERKLDKLTESIDVAKTIKNLTKGIKLDGIINNPNKSMGKKNGYGVSGKDIVKYVENISEDIILGQVMDVSKVSNLKINRDDESPSNIKDKGKGNIKKIDEALFSLYCADVFASYTDKKEDSLLNYEMEYILCGHEGDKENLSESVAKLLALREATNVIAILSNPDMLNEARTLALSTFGLTGVPAITVLGEVLIVAAWGYAESVLDVRNLLAKGRCKLIKKRTDFKLSLGNIGSIMNGSFVETEGEGETIHDGLNYKEFLEILMFATGKTSKYYRAMDLIEERTKQKKDDFRMNQCIVKASVDIKYELKPLFISKDITKNFMEGGTVFVNRKAEYGY